VKIENEIFFINADLVDFLREHEKKLLELIIIDFWVIFVIESAQIIEGELNIL